MNEAGEYIKNNIVEGLEYCRACAIHYDDGNILSETDAKTAVNKALEQVGKEVDKNEFSTFLLRKDSLDKIITALKL